MRESGRVLFELEAAAVDSPSLPSAVGGRLWELRRHLLRQRARRAEQGARYGSLPLVEAPFHDRPPVRGMAALVGRNLLEGGADLRDLASPGELRDDPRGDALVE